MKQLFYLIFVLFFVCCNSNKSSEKKYDENRVQFINNFIQNSDTSYNYPYDTKIFHIGKLIDELHLKSPNQTGLIYVMNSECSACIGKFLDFVFYLKQSKNKFPIVAIIEVGTKETLTYYIEQTKLNKEFDFYFYENIENKYIEGSLDNQNGKIFYIYKDRVINSFSYESF